MLEPKDLKTIAKIAEEKSDKRMTKTEKFILDEIDRPDQKIEVVRKNLEELEQYYKITKLENDNTEILLQLIENLRKDVEELKKKIA